MLSAVFSLLTTLGLYSLVLIAGTWLWFRWSNREVLKAAAKLPVVLPIVPFFGHTHYAIRGLEDASLLILKMTLGSFMKGIKTVCFWIGSLPLVCIQNIDDIQLLLNGPNTSDKADEYECFLTGMDSGAGPFKNHILSATGAEWKATRKHMNPMFHPRNVQQLFPVFNANSHELVERISRHEGRGPFNVMEYTMDVGLKTICNLIFGPQVDIDVNAEAFKGILQVVEEVPALFVLRIAQPWIRPEFLFRFFCRRKIREISDRWKNFTEMPLKISRDHHNQKEQRKSIFNINELNENSSNEANQEYINFLDVYTIFQQSYPELTEADLRSQIIALFCTGTDTIGSVTASCLLALAQYQDIQDRLYRDIHSVVGQDEDVTVEHLNSLPYLDMVLKETLRKFLIVPFIIRKLTKDVQFSECKMPAGSPILVNLASIHMDPNIYPNPTKFDPDRFAPENSAGKEKFAFVPFSGGPRICIAKTYAMQLIKIELVHVLRKFKISTTQDIDKLKTKLIVTLVSTEGYNLTLEKRSPDKQLVESD